MKNKHSFDAADFYFALENVKDIALDFAVMWRKKNRERLGREATHEEVEQDADDFLNSIRRLRQAVINLSGENILSLILHLACFGQLNEELLTLSNLSYEEEKENEKIKKRLKAKKAAYVRHQRSPKFQAKNEVNALWSSWKQHPDRYTSASAFARDMLDKFPDELSSQQTVQRWVTAWEKERALKKK